MSGSKSYGFDRKDLEARYNVDEVHEDYWHSFADQKRQVLIGDALRMVCGQAHLLLNAGSGVHRIEFPPWTEVSVDLFWKPLKGRRLAVCSNVLCLPFRDREFD